MFLAQFTQVDPKILAHILAVLAALFGIGLSIYLAYQAVHKRGTRIEQPLEVIEGDRAITRSYCNAQHKGTSDQLHQMDARISRVESDLQQFKADVLANGEARKNFIVSHVNDVRLELKADITGIHRRLDDLPQMILKLLTRKP
jgi:hypothetical protein